MVAAFEVAGIFGMLTSGWLTNRSSEAEARACLVYMILCFGSLLMFWMLPTSSRLVQYGLLCIAGFFIYGPQSLVGIAAANLATNRAAASAIGLTGLFGYLGTIISGFGVGLLVEHHGWDAGFLMFAISALIGAILFAH